MKHPLLISFACAGFFLRASFAQEKDVQEQTGPKYGLPSGARVIEEQALTSAGHPDRTFILWMLNPDKHPTDYKPGDSYTCPDRTRGSYYSGPTRVALLNTKTGAIIDTVEIKQEYNDGEDSFDIPYAIRKGFYYRVEGNPKKDEEVKPHLLWLKDYNGDGKALEFALFDAEACMGLATTLIGYSERHDKLVQYPIRLTADDGTKHPVEVLHWCDYLFSKKPTAPRYWKYEIDYRGRGGSLDKYEIRYNPQNEAFEGTLTSKTDDH